METFRLIGFLGKLDEIFPSTKCSSSANKEPGYMEEHDIHSFIQSAQRDIENEYKRILKRATEDPGTAGDQGEENWATLLKNWLPSYFHIVTKGRILTESGYASPQVDILILHPSYPQILLDKKLYLAGG